MKKKFKALMIDVDGTLVPNRMDGMPSQKIIDAINKASEKVHIGVATSRPLFLLKEIFRTLNLNGPSVIHGGGQIVDAQTHEILWEQPILEEDIKKVHKIFKALNMPTHISYKDADKEYDGSVKLDKPLQIFAIGVDQKTTEKLHEEISKISTLVFHIVPSWQKGQVGIVITHAQATKQHGIFEVAKILNIDTKEIIGIGDGGNDFPLLMACGLKVAMGNATDDLKAIADYIAPSVEEDGVADVIRKFIL